jgi:hypothetical protein
MGSPKPCYGAQIAPESGKAEINIPLSIVKKNHVFTVLLLHSLGATHGKR